MTFRFDDAYYRSVLKEYGYSSFEFEEINFRLASLTESELRQKWLCHHEGTVFAQAVATNGSAIVTSGIGLSGPPHMGTLSQILRAIVLQKAGLDVQFVLGDLDAYNARNQSLGAAGELADKYHELITNLGFDARQGILRRQLGHTEIAQTAYLISNCLTDADFLAAEEDLSELYIKKGVYPGIEFPVKQAILLMVADFIHLGDTSGYKYVLIMLGLEEHLYVQLARKVVARRNLDMHIGGMYSRIIKGFGGYPKMSKSIPGSAIAIDMSPKEIRDLVLDAEGEYDDPGESVVFQMMSAVSLYSRAELARLEEACRGGGSQWRRMKEDYVEMLVDLFKKWPGK